MSATTGAQRALADDELRIAIRSALSGNAILFLGAGAAAAAKRRDGAPLPAGQQLSDALASACELGPGYSLDSIAQHFLETRSETALINALRKQLEISSIDGVLTALASIPWIRIWTTNYDDAFERALTEANKSHHSITTADGVRAAQGNRLLLIHINGDLKRLKQSLTPDFILTSESYATNMFMSTEWSTVLRNDLQRAKSIIFVGYSLADIDIARLVFNPELYRSKVHFVDREDIDPVLRTKLSKFGAVHSIGIDALRSIVDGEKALWRPPQLIEEYQYWSRVLPEGPLRTPSDDDFYDLILRGVPRDDLLLSQIGSPDVPAYTVVRSCEDPCVRHLGKPGAVAAVVGSFANGKTIALRAIALRLATQGRDVFVLERPAELARGELLRLCRRDADFVLVLENYSRNLELIESFCLYARTGCSLLTSERAEVHELRLPALTQKMKERDLEIFDVDILENGEVDRLSDLLSLRGLWGERAGLSEVQRLLYLKHDCDRQIHAVLIEVANSPQIRSRLNEIVDQFETIEGGLRILIALSLLQVIGEEPRIAVVAELLQLSHNSFQKLTKNDAARQILAVSSGVANFRSPIMANAVLTGINNAVTITEVVVECVKRGEQSRLADPYLGTISRELTRFATLERILPDKGKRAALQNFYEELKNIPSIRKNPHYWLQYAMARLSLGELQIARTYFEQSYSFAKKISGYDTFQIDNHFCRLLLREAENTTDSDEAFKSVDDALQILKRQVLRENRHYPYRSAWNLEGVTRRHRSNWTQAQCKSIVNSAQYLIDAANRLDHAVARSVAVVGGLQRLRSVVVELS